MTLNLKLLLSYRSYTGEERGGGGKNRRIAADKAYDILNETVMKYDWEEKMTLSVPRIKSFLFKTKYKMQ